MGYHDSLLQDEFENITETENISLVCKDCYHFQHDPDLDSYSITCKSDGSWNETVANCVATYCEIDVDDETVEETTEEQPTTCHTNRTLACKNEFEHFNFEFGLTTLSGVCYPR